MRKDPGSRGAGGAAHCGVPRVPTPPARDPGASRYGPGQQPPRPAGTSGATRSPQRWPTAPAPRQQREADPQPTSFSQIPSPVPSDWSPPPPRFPSAHRRPPVHVLQLRLLLLRELLQLQPLAGPQLGQLGPELPALLLGGCQAGGELLAEHLGQVAPLADQLLVHLGRPRAGVSGRGGGARGRRGRRPPLPRAHRRQVRQLLLLLPHQAPQAPALPLGLPEAPLQLAAPLLQRPLRPLQLGELRRVLVPDALDAGGQGRGQGAPGPPAEARDEGRRLTGSPPPSGSPPWRASCQPPAGG